MKPRRSTHAFVYRAGIGLLGTHITCDASGFASDLIFLSHARALAPRGPAALAGARAGRRQIVTTEKTLRLLGEHGEKLRARTLPAAFGRPFNLGDQRLEVIPSGFLPGAAGLLCETESRRVLYLGSFCPAPIVDGMDGFEPAEIRQADAVCIDATCGDPTLIFPTRKQALGQVREFVETSLREGRTPALLASPFGALPAIVIELFRAGIAMRAHRHIVAVLARLRSVCGSLPALSRFTGKVDRGEVLFWPPEARNAADLRALGDLRLALVSGAAADPDVPARMGLDAGFALTNRPGFAEILTAIAASGAREVALFHGGAELAATLLRERGFDAYAIGPPRQMTLPVDD
jgi:putative mRNA 3-end processing factor